MSQAGVIDSLHFARAALEQRGVLGLEQLPRLAKMQLNVGQLVEDEVILALPMVPRHAACVHHPVT